jgi:hypothetical protein
MEMKVAAVVCMITAIALHGSVAGIYMKEYPDYAAHGMCKWP